MLQTDQLLWLPEGSVRALLAIGTSGGFFAGLVPLEIMTLVLGFYFVGRAASKPTV